VSHVQGLVRKVKVLDVFREHHSVSLCQTNGRMCLLTQTLLAQIIFV
jgi:hypothetical protein